ncbi:MAG TPA: protein kinase, partial [Thermomicrobiales bacterium]|nr:protein kinase [Thermomicrobiales bacterium]
MIEQQTTVNGRYRVDRRVGEGGMAVVFRGYDLLLGREVAIKALRPQYAADPAFRLRFEREARAAAGFRHPNIVQIFDVGEEHGAPYFVMEYVEGQTLAEIVAAEAPFHPDDVAALLRQLAAALDYAHERGYVHRDVKPQNIIVDADGHARVVDFGIAKGLGDSDLTATGAGLGTVQYISPEQASGLMATPASDIYSAGVVAFEMLTGRVPFEADSPVAVAMKHVNDPPPPPSDLLSTIPPAVDAIVLRAIAKDPTQRFSSAGALAEAMGRWRRYLPPTPQSATGRWAQPTAPLPTASMPATTAPPPAGLGGPRPARTQAPVPVTGAARPRNGRGGTWLFGLLILAGMIGLIWFGIRFAADLGQFGGAPAVTTEGAAAPTAAVVVEAPTFEPAIVVSDSPPPTIAPAAPTSAPQTVAVPNLIGQSVEAARAALTPLGLVVQVGDPVESADVPQGAIARQN